LSYVNSFKRTAAMAAVGAAAAGVAVVGMSSGAWAAPTSAKNAVPVTADEEEDERRDEGGEAGSGGSATVRVEKRIPRPRFTHRHPGHPGLAIGYTSTLFAEVVW